MGSKHGLCGYAIPANSQRGIFMVGVLACFLVAPFVTLLPAAIAAGIATFLIFKILRIEKKSELACRDVGGCWKAQELIAEQCSKRRRVPHLPLTEARQIPGATNYQLQGLNILSADTSLKLVCDPGCVPCQMGSRTVALSA
ncbi:hypothetical protein KR52_12190 [Synechococcus sp. KORDI-52]|uniref:hypothetical protein n=1 Tax=Synechococcus sp. KORDI-52 TaxID=585425 RepID=UPI0004E0860E|nr:hypothetical protein [Synechococcus sp. KORDI-52]AII49890.1 hypothetical protein KR52_12190 [Synechococcus sp. KORDI-52]